MRVLIINSVCGIRSTGRIATDIAKEYMAQGHLCQIAYGREQVPEEYRDISYRIGSDWDIRMNALKARLFDNEGFNAKKETKRFIKWANNYNPDLLWIHNIHGYYINIELLFDWIKRRPQMQVKWTLHDCWPFTGHCSYFSFVGCNRWQYGCAKCCQRKKYPASLLIDASRQNYERKKRAFSGVENLKLIAPSKWLAALVKVSFLREYSVEVCHNMIDKTAFRPTMSDFRERYGLKERKIVLGVASTWDERKGLSDFLALVPLLRPDYVVVLVGVEEGEIKNCPPSVVCIPPTNSKKELAEIYTAADVFVNPSKEETFGLTTLEALSCGTPAVVYKDTACEEVADKYGGIAVEQSVHAIKIAIEELIVGGGHSENPISWDSM